MVVREAVALARPGAVVVDLCCGTGAVGVAIHAAVGGVELHASDIEPAAVRCARRNVEPLGGALYEGDLFDPLPASLRGRVDLLVVNAPYVPTDAIALMPPEAREHEPHITLDGGADGVDIQRRVAAGGSRVAGAWRTPADRDESGAVTPYGRRVPRRWPDRGGAPRRGRRRNCRDRRTRWLMGCHHSACECENLSSASRSSSVSPGVPQDPTTRLGQRRPRVLSYPPRQLLR